MKLLNCWLVALWLWVASRGRAYLWMRRSLHFKGWIPHAGTGHHTGWRSMKLVEYVPCKADLWTMRNFVVLFDGEYRVWKVRVVSVRRFKTMAEANAYLKE